MQQALVSLVVLLRLPQLCLCLGKVGILLSYARVRRLYARSQHPARAAGVEQGGLCLLLLYQIFAVVEHNKGVALMHKLMLAEAHFLDISAYTDVYRGYILVDKRVVGYFVADVSPEIVCGPGQSRAGYDDTHYVKNDITAAPLLQALIFQMDYRHVVYVGYFNKMLSLLQFADSALQFIVGVCHLRACRGKLQFGVKP